MWVSFVQAIDAWQAAAQKLDAILSSVDCRLHVC